MKLRSPAPALTATLSFALLAACSPPSGQPDAGQPGGGLPDASVATCPTLTGAGTSHEGILSASETWTAAASPHLVTFDLSVPSGATLTIEPCAVVQVKPGYSIVVEGHLVAEGTATQPIDFGPSDATHPWGYLQVFVPGTVTLAYATLHGGGGQTVNSEGMLEARGDQSLVAQEILKVDHVTVSGSRTYGVSLRGSGAFTHDSQALTVTGSAKEALRILPRLATNIPTGTYTGNAVDAIMVETEAYGDVNLEDVTFHDRGVPYHVGGPTTFGQLNVGPNHYALTFEAGVKLAFSSSGWLATKSSSGSTGALVAHGTAAKPVVFTSSAAAPVAGSWRGLVLGSVPDSRNLLDHVEIRYAGAASQASGAHCEPVKGYYVSEDAALAIFHQPAGELLTNSLIADSAALGVDLAYYGAPVDFLTGNQFTNVASCKVSTPRQPDGSCPTTVSCP